MPDVRLDQWTGLKGHDGNLDFQLRQFLFLLPQLRQMFATGESPQVTVKNQQQPTPCKIAQAMHLARHIPQLKINRPGHGIYLAHETIFP